MPHIFYLWPLSLTLMVLKKPAAKKAPTPPELVQPGAGAARPTRIRLRSASELAGWGRAAAPSQQRAR